MAIAEKLQITLDFNGPVDFPTFSRQVEQLVGERNLLLHLAFDAFDSNNDDKISELDLFKLLYQFSKGSNIAKDDMSERFLDVFLTDFTQITKTFDKYWSSKFKKLLSDNGGDRLYVDRITSTRNV